MAENTEKKDEKILWLKKGGGTFRLPRGKIVKPNEKFYAYLEEIPVNFRDVVVPVEDLPEEKPLQRESEKPRFEIVSKTGGWYDIINTESGKPINSKSLRAEEAKQQLDELT